MRISLNPFGSRRRRRGSARPSGIFAGGLAVIGLLVVLAVLLLQTPQGVPGARYLDLTAAVPDAGNLQPHNDVRIAGVRVGQVLRVVPNQQGTADVELQLGSGTKRIPADSTVMVRAQGLLGTRYVEIVPGRSAAGAADGGRLTGGRFSLTAGVPETLDTFDAATRGALGTSLGGLGQGLFGNGRRLAGAFDVAPKAGRDFQGTIATVLARPGAAERLLPALSLGMHAADRARGPLTEALEPGVAAVQPLIDRRQALQETLDEAPSTLRQADAGLGSGERLLASARRLADAASETLPRAPGALRATTALLRESPTPLRSATRLLRTAQPAVPDVLRITDGLQPLLPRLDALATHARPLLVTTLGTYGCGVKSFVDNWRSTLGTGINQVQQRPLGPVNNFNVTVNAGTSSVQGVKLGQEGLLKKDAYFSPCRYANTSPKYDTASTLTGKGG